MGRESVGGAQKSVDNSCGGETILESLNKKAAATRHSAPPREHNPGAQNAKGALMDKIRILYTSMNVLATISAASAFVFFFAMGKPEWATPESGCLEITQAVILTATLAIFIAALCRKGNKNEKWITLFLAVLCYAFILREVDFDKMGLPDALVFMLYGHGRTAAIVAGFAVALIGAALSFKTYVRSSLRLLFSKRGFLLAASCAMLWTGYFFEHHTKLETNELLEEFFELIGYILLLTEAYKTERIAEGKDTPQNA